MNEKELMVNDAIAILNSHGLPFVHLPNRVFKGRRYRTDGGNLQGFPDLMFPWRGKDYQREYGIKGRNKKQKASQEDYMTDWVGHGNVDGKIIYSKEAMLEDFRKLGLIN